MTRGCRLLQVGGCRTTGGAFEKKISCAQFQSYDMCRSIWAYGSLWKGGRT